MLVKPPRPSWLELRRSPTNDTARTVIVGGVGWAIHGLPAGKGRPAPRSLRRCRAARAGARTGAAEGAGVRTDIEQHHLRGVRRGHVLLEFLSRRGGLGPHARVGLRRGGCEPA